VQLGVGLRDGHGKGMGAGVMGAFTRANG